LGTRAISDASSPIMCLRLNVSEQCFVTTRALLCIVEGLMLAAIFSPDSQFAPPVEILDREFFR